MLNQLLQNVTLENYNNFIPITGIKLHKFQFVIISYLKAM